MSVLIKGMEMPTSCADCRLMADGWCYSVGFEQREKISTVKRPTWCPLVPVPPHGRLIDADAVTDAAMEDILGWEEAGCDRDDYRAFIANYIEDAPTIIPGEGE